MTEKLDILCQHCPEPQIVRVRVMTTAVLSIEEYKDFQDILMTAPSILDQYATHQDSVTFMKSLMNHSASFCVDTIEGSDFDDTFVCVEGEVHPR